jgi:hypothetical protein
LAEIREKKSNLLFGPAFCSAAKQDYGRQTFGPLSNDCRKVGVRRNDNAPLDSRAVENSFIIGGLKIASSSAACIP